MESANFIPLGAAMMRASFDQPGTYKPKVIGETPEELKRVAREVRLAARKEKKKIKSDAKKQRKQNAIMHRRMTRNNEKYDKNKERNRQRAIDLERTTIRERAVQQVERLAAQHDPSGKMFNVGELIILPDGTVKSKERIRKAEEARIQRQAERKAEAEAKQAALEVKTAAKEARKNGEVLPIDGVNPQRLAQIETVPGVPPPKRMSKTQQKKLEMYAPNPVPPKPVIPEGISFNLPKGEENFLVLWDITDEQIQRRLGEARRKKALARRQLKLQQKKEKAFRRQMKAKKKQAHNRGEDFDPEKAAQEILAAQKTAQNKSKSQSDSGSSSESDSESDSEPDEDVEAIEATKEVTEVTVEASWFSIDIDTKQAKKSKKRSNLEPADVKIEPIEAGSSSDKKSKTSKKSKKSTDSDNGEPKPKKSKKSKAHTTEETEMTEASVTHGSDEARIKDEKNEKKGKPKFDAVKADSDQEAQAQVLEEFMRKEKRLLQKEKEREILATSCEVAVRDGRSSKKRKRAEDQEQEGKPKKAHKKSEVQAEELSINGALNSAKQWNPEALTGDEARKEKFLRLLGAKKSKGESLTKHKSKWKSADISRVQSDLEKQYEAGMKLKHDGGSKRRGLGS